MIPWYYSSYFRPSHCSLQAYSSMLAEGSLYWIKNFFNHRNVNYDASQCFNHAVELLDFMMDGDIVGMALAYMKTHQPTDIPGDLQRMTSMPRLCIVMLSLTMFLALPSIPLLLPSCCRGPTMRSRAIIAVARHLEPLWSSVRMAPGVVAPSGTTSPVLALRGHQRGSGTAIDARQSTTA